MRMVSYGFVGVEPEVMGFGPIPSTEKALRLAGLTIGDIGLFELNEAFAVQVLAFLDHFGIADDDPRVNPWGGAIAIGHPLASSGVRLMTQLARAVRRAPGGPVRPHCDVHRHRHGRHRDLGEPGVDDVHPVSSAGGRQVTLPEYPNEIVTKALLRFVAVPGLAKKAALITLDNGLDHTKPNSFGPGGLRSLSDAYDRAAAADPAFIALTGKPYIFCVGADITGMPFLRSRDQAVALGELGHQVFAKFKNSSVPTFAFINGAALGGGLEVSLHCHYRTVSGRRRRARAARGRDRPGPRLGRQSAAAEPDRHPGRGHRHPAEPAHPEGAAAEGGGGTGRRRHPVRAGRLPGAFARVGGRRSSTERSR